MKNVTMVFLLIALSFNLPIFGQYTVKIRIGEVDPISADPKEWLARTYADISIELDR